MKATSETKLYENSKEMKAGVVYYKGGELSFFPLNTAIQPDNLHPVAHSYLAKCHSESSLKYLGHMPTDFHDRLIAAIKASITLSEERKQNLLKRL